MIKKLFILVFLALPLSLAAQNLKFWNRKHCRCIQFDAREGNSREAA